jgi:hypothetical protein
MPPGRLNCGFGIARVVHADDDALTLVDAREPRKGEFKARRGFVGGFVPGK